MLFFSGYNEQNPVITNKNIEFSTIFSWNVDLANVSFFLKSFFKDFFMHAFKVSSNN